MNKFTSFFMLKNINNNGDLYEKNINFYYEYYVSDNV